MNTKRSGLNKYAFYYVLCITILVLIGLYICFSRIVLSDYKAINGDFQNFNVWRRFLSGQTPFKEFAVYLGIGHLLLGSLFTFIFGSTFTASLFASHFLSYSIFVLFCLIVSYFITHCFKLSFLNSVFICLFVFLFPSLFNNLILKDLWEGLNLMLTPGNSARLIRSSGLIFETLIILAICKMLYKQKHSLSKYIFKSITLYELLFVISLAAISGMFMVFSNDMGVSSYIAFSFLFFFALLKIYGFNIAKISSFTFIYIIFSVLAAFAVVSIITKGEPMAWLQYTLGVSKYQGWYYGVAEEKKSYNISQLNYSFISISTMLIIIVNLFFIMKQDSVSKNLSRLFLTWFLLSAMISTNLYRIMSGGFTNEILNLLFFIYCTASLLNILRAKEYIENKYVSYVCCGCLMLIIMVFPAKYIHLANEFKTENRKGVYVKELGGYTTLTDSFIPIKNIIGDNKIFSTYASALEVTTNQFQPSGYDYIIHVLGDKARVDYLNTFINGDYPYVQTLNLDYSAWEHWVFSSNWFFYKELFKRYDKVLSTGYANLWKRKDKEQTVEINKDEIQISINQLTESKVEIQLNCNKDIDFIADVKLSYNGTFKEPFYKTGIYNKFVHITDVTRFEKFNDIYVNYFIPPNSEGYNIPIIVKQGEGKVIIDSYPNKNTTLVIHKASIEELITYY